MFEKRCAWFLWLSWRLLGRPILSKGRDLGKNQKHYKNAGQWPYIASRKGLCWKEYSFQFFPTSDTIFFPNLAPISTRIPQEPRKISQILSKSFQDVNIIVKLLQDFCQKTQGLSTMTFALAQISVFLAELLDLFAGVLVGTLAGTSLEVNAIFAGNILS